jgi:hypothetical protein
MHRQKKNKKKRDEQELNLRPIGLQPIALPLSYHPVHTMKTNKNSWRSRVSIPVHPACKAGALPFELHPHNRLMLESTSPQQSVTKNPGNRSRTSDLEISIVAIYSLPLCQLSYTRIGTMKREKKKRCSLWGSNPRSYEHAP